MLLREVCKKQDVNNTQTILWSLSILFRSQICKLYFRDVSKTMKETQSEFFSSIFIYFLASNCLR